MGLFNGKQKVESSGWARPYDIADLRRRLASCPADDPLLPLLLGYLDSHVVAHADTKVSADDAAHQFVGRLNMLSDLRADLQRVWDQAHEG